MYRLWCFQEILHRTDDVVISSKPRALLVKLVEALDIYEDNIGFLEPDSPHEELIVTNLFAAIKAARTNNKETSDDYSSSFQT